MENKSYKKNEKTCNQSWDVRKTSINFYFFLLLSVIFLYKVSYAQ